MIKNCGEFWEPLIYLESLLNAIRSIHETRATQVKVDHNKTTEAFEVNRLGCGLAAGSDKGLERSVFKLQTILEHYNIKISEGKTKSMAVIGKILLRVNELHNYKPTKEVKYFIYFGCHIYVSE